MSGVTFYSLAAHIALRERLREREPALSLLGGWSERPGEWRVALRPKLLELLGLPCQGCELEVREVEWVDAEGYSRTKVVYHVEPGVAATAWVCVPHDNQMPLPAVVCAHPRGADKDALVGLTGDPQLGYAAALAQRGYVTIAPDARCHGERMDDERGLTAVGVLLGEPLLGRQVHDLLRAVDYLAQRPEVRPDRIGVTGVGIGALQALLAAAVDERIACTAVCGGLSTLTELIVASDCFRHCEPPQDLLPGLLRYADLDDIACLVAPRPLMLAHRRGDGTVPLAGVQWCFERVRAGFRLLGEEVKLETALVESGGEYLGDLLFRFLEDWLKLPGP